MSIQSLPNASFIDSMSITRGLGMTPLGIACREIALRNIKSTLSPGSHRYRREEMRLFWLAAKGYTRAELYTDGLDKVFHNYLGRDLDFTTTFFPTTVVASDRSKERYCHIQQHLINLDTLRLHQLKTLVCKIIESKPSKKRRTCLNLDRKSNLKDLRERISHLKGLIIGREVLLDEARQMPDATSIEVGSSVESNLHDLGIITHTP